MDIPNSVTNIKAVQVYLGDGVYAFLDSDGVTLKTNTYQIYLGPKEMDGLVRYWGKVRGNG